VWNILVATYATPSRGCIKQVNANLKLLTKGTLSIIDFLQLVKAMADELAVLGALVDNEDLTDKILEELGDDYQELVRAVQARENAFSFDEFYEKLLMFEALLQETNKLVNCFPPTTHPTNHTSGRYPFTNVGHSTPKNSGGNWRCSVDQQHCYLRQNQFVASHNITNSNRPPPRQYLSYFQIYGLQGHTAKKIPHPILFLSTTTKVTAPLCGNRRLTLR
jgi:hypothetical protein